MNWKKLLKKKIELFIGDVGDYEKLQQVFASGSLDTVIHCAGKKSVPESISFPLKYFVSNISKSLRLLEVMENLRSTL